MAQLSAPVKKKEKKKKQYKVELWQKEPTGDEMKEMAEITECFEDDGIDIDPETIRNAIVNDNMPKYMTLIEKDLKEDRAMQKELDYFSLQERQKDPSSLDVFHGTQSPGSNLRQNAFGPQIVHKDGTVNIDLASKEPIVSDEGDNVSNFDATPWNEFGESPIDVVSPEGMTAASKITGKEKLLKQMKRKKKKKGKTKIPKYPEEGLNLMKVQDFENHYNSLFYD